VVFLAAVILRYVFGARLWSARATKFPAWLAKCLSE
jgi:hypothetical protein